MIDKTAVVQSKIPESVRVLEYSIIREGCSIGENVIIGPHSIVGPRCSIGEGTRVLPFAHLESDVKVGSSSLVGPHTNLRPETRIGDFSVFGTLSQSEGKNRIGSHVTIHTNCHITQGVEIEDWVFIAPFFVGANTPRIVHGRNYPMEVKGYRVKFGARIAIDVSVMPGVTIGREALIGAGSLVTKDVPDFAIAFGRPAQIRGEVPESERLHV